MEEDQVELLRQELVRLEEDMDTCKDNFTKELAVGGERMTCISDQVEEVDNKINNMSDRMETLISVFETLEKAVKALGWLGKLIKWVVGIGVAIYALKLFFTTGHWK